MVFYQILNKMCPNYLSWLAIHLSLIHAYSHLLENKEDCVWGKYFTCSDNNGYQAFGWNKVCNKLSFQGQDRSPDSQLFSDFSYTGPITTQSALLYPVRNLSLSKCDCMFFSAQESLHVLLLRSQKCLCIYDKLCCYATSCLTLLPPHGL